MSAHIGTNFTLESKEFLDSRQGLALTKKDLLDWRTPVPEGFRVCLDRKWYYYDSSANLEDTGHWVPCVVDNVDGEVYEGQTVSAKAVKELGSINGGLVSELESKLSKINNLVNPLQLSNNAEPITDPSIVGELVEFKLPELIGKKVENSEPDKAFDLNNDGVIDEADKALWETTNKELKKLSEDKTYYSTSSPRDAMFEVGHKILPSVSIGLQRKSGAIDESVDGIKQMTIRLIDNSRPSPVNNFLNFGGSSWTYNKLVTKTFPSDILINSVVITKNNTRLSTNATYKFRYRKFIGASELLDLSGGTIKSSQLEGKLVSSFVESGTLDKTVFNCSGGKYPYIIIPALYYNPTNKMYVGGFLNTDLVVEDVKIENKVGIVVPYKVIRTRLKQTGSSIPVQITAQ
jgi:hypothetical protein|nr:MAG TPA: hypothetical protein [Caudoviricetes sp.]